MRAPGISDLAPQREPRTFGKIVPMPDESRSKDVEEPTKPGRQKREFEGPKGEPTTRSSSTTKKGPVLRTPLATVSGTARYQSRWSVGRNKRGARPAGFEPATCGLEVRNELTAGNDLKQEKRLPKPNPLRLRLLDVSGCLYALESG